MNQPVALLLSLAFLAPVSPKSSWERRSEAETAAGVLATDGKHGEAAALLEALAVSFEKREDPAERTNITELKAEASEYRARLPLVEKAKADDSAARRALLRALCFPASSKVRAHAPIEPQISALIGQLRKVDPAAEKFFSRKVKVVASAPEGLDPGDLQLLVDGVVQALRDLGMTADVASGDDLFTLAITIPAPREIPKNEIGVAGMSHGQTQVVCRLTSNGELVLGSMDFSASGAGFSPENARRQAVKSAAAKAKFGILKAWLSTQP